MSYQTQAAIGPYPVNCLLQAFLLALALAGIVADVFLPAPLSMFRLPFSVCYRSGCCAPAVDGYSLVSSIAGIAIAIGSRDTFDFIHLL
jgi:hypothetical protein